MKKYLFLGMFCVSFLSTLIAQNKEITVDNVQDLLDAIGPDRTINLKSGTYDLSSVSEQISTSDYYSYNNQHDGNEVIIHDIKNLTIKGIGSRPAEIITRPQYGNVLVFQGCTNISLENIEAGHGPEKGYCTGGVIKIAGGGDFSFKNCIFYGSGTEGITADYVIGITAENTTIRNCTYGIMSLTNCQDVQFNGCDFMDNEEFEMVTLRECENVIFQDCHFKRNQSKGDFMGLFFNIYAPKNSIKLKKCLFQHNNAKHFAERKDDFKFDKTDFSNNTFRAGKFPN